MKIFCRCSLFPSWSGYGLSALLYNIAKHFVHVLVDVVCLWVFCNDVLVPLLQLGYLLLPLPFVVCHFGCLTTEKTFRP